MILAWKRRIFETESDRHIEYWLSKLHRYSPDCNLWHWEIHYALPCETHHRKGNYYWPQNNNSNHHVGPQKRIPGQQPLTRSIYFLFILGNSGTPQMTLAILRLIPSPVFLALPSITLLWWDYSEGGSKCQAHCLNFDWHKIVAKISRESPYKEIHVTFWRPCCLDQNSNNLTRILTPPQNSPTTAVLENNGHWQQGMDK